MAIIKTINVNGQPYSVGYSSNDYTTVDKTKLANIDAGAQVNVIETIEVDGIPATVSNKKATVKGLQKKLTAGAGIRIVDDEISTEFDGYPFTFVSELPKPAEGWRPGQTPINFDIKKIYVVPNKSGSSGGLQPQGGAGQVNMFNEYIWNNQASNWELLGEFKAEVDLSPYLKKAEFETYKSSTATTISGLNQKVSAAEGDISNLKANKVDKIPGKGLSENDFTTALKTRLEGVSAGANKVTFNVSGEILTITVS